MGIFLSKMNARGFFCSNVHVIGYSLGAYVASIAGQRVKSLNNILARLHILLLFLFLFSLSCFNLKE